MSDPFRGAADAGDAHAFSQHLGVAEDTLEHVESIPRRLEALANGPVTQPLLDGLAQQFAQGWETVWDQLQSARDVCRRMGRDVTAYDTARAAVGDIYVDVAQGRAVTLGNRVEVTWKNVPTSTARAAIAALRAAVPEVVVVKQAPLDVDLRSTGAKALTGLYALLGVVALFSAIYAIFRALN